MSPKLGLAQTAIAVPVGRVIAVDVSRSYLFPGRQSMRRLASIVLVLCHGYSHAQKVEGLWAASA